VVTEHVELDWLLDAEALVHDALLISPLFASVTAGLEGTQVSQISGGVHLACREWAAACGASNGSLSEKIRKGHRSNLRVVGVTPQQVAESRR
jgi:hypothetical protein